MTCQINDRAYLPAWAMDFCAVKALKPLQMIVFLGVLSLDPVKGLYGSVTWFATNVLKNRFDRSQVSRCLIDLQKRGILEKRITGGYVSLQLSMQATKFAKQFLDRHTQKTEVAQQGPIFEPSDVFKEHYNTNTKTRNKAAKCTSKGASVTNYHGECDESSRSSVTICHTYIQSKIQSKNTKYITYGQDNFLCIYDEQGKLIDAHYAGKAQDVAQACEAYACIKNKTSYQSQNLDLEKIPLENKCGELKGCDLACTAPKLLSTVVSTLGTEQADSTAKKERDFKDESSSSGSTSNGATELLSLNSSGDIASSEIKLIVTEGGSLGTDSQALRDLPDDGQSQNGLTLGNNSSLLTPVEERQKTQVLSGNAGSSKCVATQDLLADVNAAKSSGESKVKPTKTSKAASFEPRIKHQDILDCLKRVYSLEGEIAEECAQEVEKRFGGDRNWRWGHRAMTTDDLFQVCYWPVANRFGRDYVLAVQKANGIPCKKFKSRKTYTQAKQPGLAGSKTPTAYNNATPVAKAQNRIPRAQRTIFQIMEDAQVKSRDVAMPQNNMTNQQGVNPQFNSEGYLTNACSLDDLDNWRKTVAA